jgi:16S rRNA (guanine966-N2)-methyltransferase
LRIISGKFKGQHLVSFKADHIRPTTDRVKETVFNILQSEITGARVLDLFSGTGNLGIESLSRDCAEVTFVEKNKKSLGILSENLSKLKIVDGFRIVPQDVFKFAKAYVGEGFDVIFADPPFTESIADQVVQAVNDSNLFHHATILAIESGRREKILDDYSKLTRYDFREFGDKFLSLYRVKL